MRSAAFAVVLALMRAACALGGEAAEQLPPVPREALDAYEKGDIQIERTLEKKKKGEAITADDWEVAVGFYAEAQQKAPTSPAILTALAYAHGLRGAHVAAKAWVNAYLAAFPRAKNRLTLVQHTRERELQAQVVISNVFTEALRAAELVPQPPPGEIGGRVVHIIPTCMVDGRGLGGGAWITNSMSVHCRTEVMFLQADAGDIEGAFKTAKALADGIRQGSWDRPAVEGRDASDEWLRRFSVWKAGHDALAAAGDWAGATALYAEHDRAGLLDREGAAGHFHTVFDFRFHPRGLRDEIRSRIDEGRRQPLALSDWLALANEVSGKNDEPGIELRLKQIRGGALKPAELVMAVAKTAVPIGQALLRVRALEGRAADQALKAFDDSYHKAPSVKAAKEEATRFLATVPELIFLRSSDFGETALIDAAGSDSGQVELLLAKGSDPNARSYWGMTALHYAATFNARGSARALLAKGATVNARAYDGRTPLHNAAGPYPDMVQLLLDAGADATLQARDGKTALDLAEGDLGKVNPAAKADMEKAIALLRKATGADK